VIGSQKPAEPAAEGERVAASAFVTSLAMLAAMAVGGLLAIVVLLKFGKNAETDGFFAAYGVYAVLLALAQNLRASVVARFVEGPSVEQRLNRFLGSALIIVVVVGALLLPLAKPIADLLTGSLPSQSEETAREALLILWIAAGAQFIGALAAAALGIHGDFLVPGLAYVGAGLFAIVFVVGLGDGLGIEAVSIGLAAGSVAALFAMFGRLVQKGHRLRVSEIAEGRRYLKATAVVLVGSVGSVALQLSYVVSLGFASHIGQGSVTLYSYAFFAAALITGASSAPAAIVLAAPLSKSWDRRPESLEPHLLVVFRAGSTLAVPVFAIAAIVGPEVIDWIPSASLTHADANTIVTTFLSLAGLILATIAVPVPGLAAFASSRYLGVAGASAIALAVHVVGTAAVLPLDSLQALAGVASLSTICSLAAIVGLVYGKQWRSPLGMLAHELMRIVLVTLLAFGPVGLVAIALGGAAWSVLAVLAGICLFVPLLRARLPEHWSLLVRLIEAVPGWRATRAPVSP
jgi:peptidoglycan biosynthesis protein MviN/MurJ (putative lipid II flippase)